MWLFFLLVVIPITFCDVSVAETGLEGMLFSMLDMETDEKLRTNINDTLISMLHELAGEDLARWLSLCKAVLAASTGKCTRKPCNYGV